MTDARGRYLLNSSRANMPKIIPWKKPARIDNYHETESQNAPRKKVLAARSSGRANPKNRPGNRANLGITKTEGEILKQVYDGWKQQEAIQSRMKELKTMSNYNNVLEKAEAMLEDGEWDACEQLLDKSIAKCAADIQKAKSKKLPLVNQLAPGEDVNDAENDNIGNATGEQEFTTDDDDEEEASLPVKTKKAKSALIYPDSDDADVTGAGADNTKGHQRRIKLHTQQPDAEDALDQGADEAEEDIGKRFVEAEEAHIAKRIEMEVLDNDVNRITKIAAMSGGSGAHSLREQTIQKTLDDLEVDMTRVSKLGGLQPVKYPRGTDTVLQQHENMSAGNVEQHPDRSQRTVWSSVPSDDDDSSAFEAKVQEIMKERGLSRTASLARARLENLGLYEAYQRAYAASPVKNQQSEQREYSVEKREPLTFEAAVNAEMKKYNVTPEVAGHRVLQRYGHLPSKNFAKAADVAADWREAAQAIADRDGISATDALRKARFERPSLFRELQGRV